MYNTNIITIRDIIFSQTVRKKEELFENIADIITLVEITRAKTFIYFALKFKWAISNADFNEAKKLGQTEINKY